MKSSEVRFQEKAHGNLHLLEVVTRGRRSALETVRAELFGLEVQIVRVESVVGDADLVERFYLAEPDGGEISKRRSALIRSSVKRALRQAKTKPERPSSQAPASAG
jgi:hypothetical protein